MAYEFTPDLATGDSRIDTQHKQLIKAINDLLAACSSGKGREAIAKATKFLIDYTATHFSDEEKLQKQYKYPDLANHHQYHEKFKKDIAKIGEQLKKDGPSIVLVGQVNSSAAWLINHIKQEDKKVAAHIRSQK